MATSGIMVVDEVNKAMIKVPFVIPAVVGVGTYYGVKKLTKKKSKLPIITALVVFAGLEL